jgi:hypothetical protein
VQPVGTDHQIEFTCAVLLERDLDAAGRLRYRLNLIVENELRTRNVVRQDLT